MSALKKGDSVYRVVERILPIGQTGDEACTWTVERREVKFVDKNGGIQLVHTFTGLAKLQFRGLALGHAFHLTEAEAVQGFRPPAVKPGRAREFTGSWTWHAPTPAKTSSRNTVGEPTTAAGQRTG